MQQVWIRRGLFVVLMLLLVSVIGFVVINRSPGDFMDVYIARMQSSGSEVEIRLSGVVRGGFGWSFDFQEPVSNLINERIALTLVISLCILIFTCAAFIPVGIIVSAVKQYSLTDYTVTLHDFLGGWRRAISYARCC
jgi:peptide/nickel transport system permease protein